MQAFTVKRQNGVDTTTAIDQALMKTFKDAPAIDLAIQAGIVNEGEIVSTIEDDQPHLLPIDQLRALQEDVRHLQEEQGSIEELIPEDASTSDLLATIGQVLTAIQSLDVASVGGNGKYIKAIEENNGKISATEETFDTAVTQNSTKGVSSGAVYTAIAAASSGSASSLAAAIQALDVAEAGGTNKYIKAISETDGKISATEGTVDTTVTASSDNLITSGAVNSALSASETALQGNINAVSAKISSTASASDKVPAMSEVTSAISAEATARGTAITNAINALDVSDTAEANKYVSAVSETNGKISVTRASLPAIATFTLSGTDLIITY